ncbi:MAG: hypothetical protein JRI36_10730 [Deltaproteobacteria bacterium]|nr:hypothetical protein [Deltaproteobacteria bacterium]
MNPNRGQPTPIPPVLGLFQKRIDGDDTLLELAKRCFKKAGLGIECYAGTADELDHVLGFKPWPETPAVAHLARAINIMTNEGRDIVLDVAARFRKDLFGLVLHDQPELCSSFHDYVTALRRLADGLQEMTHPPALYVEYASGLPVDRFIRLFDAIEDLEEISCGIDIGHVGLWQVRRAFSFRHPGVDVCTLQPRDPALPDLIGEVQKAVKSATSAVIQVVKALGRHGKPIHFHLHDGHPIAAVNPLGISDHLAFSEKIPIPFLYKGKHDLDPMFGPFGLEKILEAALTQPGPERVSFTLEIHPTGRTRPLGPYDELFSHWKDKTNAKKMFHWLCMLVENHRLVMKLLHNQMPTHLKGSHHETA